MSQFLNIKTIIKKKKLLKHKTNLNTLKTNFYIQTMTQYDKKLKNPKYKIKEKKISKIKKCKNKKKKLQINSYDIRKYFKYKK